MQDQAIQSNDIAISDSQKQNAAGVLGRGFSMIASSPRAKDTARAFLQSQDFQAAGKLLGLPLEQFTVADTDDDGTLQQQAASWAQALGASGADASEDPTKVREYEYARQNGFAGSFQDYLNQYYGREVNEPASVKAARYYQSLDESGRQAYQEANRTLPIENIGGVPNRVGPGGSLQPLSTPDAEAAAKQRAAQAEATGTAGGQAVGGMKSVRVAAALRRLDRVEAASAALGAGGGPVEGRLRNLVGTPAAQELEAANAQLLPELTALTRVPGVGSQSDLEQRLAALQFPSASQHPSVRERSIQELKAFMADLDAALASVTAGPSSSTPDFSSMSDADLMRIINGQ
jgi:hypothetical protein